MIQNEDAWSRYIERNKAAAGYQHKVIKNWDAIGLVFSRDHAATSEDVSIGAENGHEMVLKSDDYVQEGTPSSPSTSESRSQDHRGPPTLTLPSPQGRRNKIQNK
uniref:Uncharacterized protein n=1 Tax=Arundo donax TaxID=35708 RepID=A0A0A9D394_ARUDO